VKYVYIMTIDWIRGYHQLWNECAPSRA